MCNVAQDSPSSDDLDDTTVTFGQQNSDKENFEKVRYESLFEQVSRQKKRCHTVSQEELQMKPHTLLDTLEKILFAVNRAFGTVKQMKTQLLGIKKQSGEDEFFCPTDKNSELQESNQTTP